MIKKKKDEEKVVVGLAEARANRKAAWEAKKVENKEEDSRDEFRKFFVKVRGKLGLTQDMEEVIWKHLKASGFDKKEKFTEGIKHFGYKL